MDPQNSLKNKGYWHQWFHEEPFTFMEPFPFHLRFVIVEKGFLDFFKSSSLQEKGEKKNCSLKDSLVNEE